MPLRPALGVIALLLASCACARAPALVLYAEVGLRGSETSATASTQTRLGAALVMPLDAVPLDSVPLDSVPLEDAVSVGDEARPGEASASTAATTFLPAPAPCRIDALCRWERVERERALRALGPQLAGR